MGWESGHSLPGLSASRSLTGLQSRCQLSVRQSEDLCTCDVNPGRESESGSGWAARSWKSGSPKTKAQSTLEPSQCTLCPKKVLSRGILGSRDLGSSGAVVGAAGEWWDESHLGYRGRQRLCLYRVWLLPRFEHIPILSKASSGAPSPIESLSRDCLHWALPGVGNPALVQWLWKGGVVSGSVPRSLSSWLQLSAPWMPQFLPCCWPHCPSFLFLDLTHMAACFFKAYKPRW